MNILEETVKAVDELRHALKVLYTMQEELTAAATALRVAVIQETPILIFGNGGSAADAMHMAAELVARFKINRKAIRAMALSTDPAITSAIGNDFGFDMGFVRQIEAYGSPRGVAIGISTSGRSENVTKGLIRARTLGMKCIALTGCAGLGIDIEDLIDIRVPSSNTPRIQEVHTLLIHVLCDYVERTVFGGE